MIRFGLVNMVNAKRISTMARGAGVTITLPYGSLQGVCKSRSVSGRGASTLPIGILFTALLLGCLIAPCFSVWSVEADGHIPAGLAGPGTKAAVVRANKLALAHSTLLIPSSGLTVTKRWVRFPAEGDALSGTVDTKGESRECHSARGAYFGGSDGAAMAKVRVSFSGQKYEIARMGAIAALSESHESFPAPGADFISFGMQSVFVSTSTHSDHCTSMGPV